MTDSKTRDGLVQLPSNKFSLFASTMLLYSSPHHEKTLTFLVKNKERRTPETKQRNSSVILVTLATSKNQSTKK